MICKPIQYVPPVREKKLLVKQKLLRYEIEIVLYDNNFYYKN